MLAEIEGEFAYERPKSDEGIIENCVRLRQSLLERGYYPVSIGTYTLSMDIDDDIDGSEPVRGGRKFNFTDRTLWAVDFLDIEWVSMGPSEGVEDEDDFLALCKCICGNEFLGTSDGSHYCPICDGHPKD